MSARLDVEAIKKQAQAELEEEQFRAAVEEYKEKLRNKRSFWDIIFPYKIVFLKKEDVKYVRRKKSKGRC